MKKIAIAALSILAVLSFGVAVGCSKDKTEEQPPVERITTTIVNGGFESADLSGWTIEYGDAFDNDCVSSVKTFSFADDEKQNALSINHTGNWYLCGKAFDGKYSVARTGAMRSTKFTLDGDGIITARATTACLPFKKTIISWNIRNPTSTLINIRQAYTIRITSMNTALICPNISARKCTCVS